MVKEYDDALLKALARLMKFREEEITDKRLLAEIETLIAKLEVLAYEIRWTAEGGE